MSTDATTPTTTHDDGTFVRTAIVVEPHADNKGSVAIVSPNGTRLALVNIFAYENGNLVVDVIDTDERFGKRAALTFIDGQRHSLDAAKVISADFRDLKGAS
jgi:hypothetical protein